LAAENGSSGRRKVPRGKFSSELRCDDDALTGAIGILGGTFDPIHNGHLSIAALARDYFGLSKILFIPAGHPPHKSVTGATPEQRLAMLRLALESEPSFKVCEGEMQRTGLSYTYDTICKLQQIFPGHELRFIIGSDNLRELETWHRYRELLPKIKLCVAHRPGHSITPPRSLAGAHVELFPSPEWGISASMIRQFVRQGYACRHLVPDAVADYIASNGLYLKR
jgi:nicotinate-nucleotide adenylyltransferase